MPFFRVKSGTHQEEGNGHIYGKGEIVESPYNLVKMHGKDKFQLTEDRPRHATDESAEEFDEDYYKPTPMKGKRGPTAPPESPREEERRKERGDDLDFQTEKKSKGKESSKAKTKAKEAEAKAEADLGDDVTDQFENAGENFRVYKKDKKYFITDLEDEVLHEEDITTKAMVNSTLEEWQAEYEE